MNATVSILIPCFNAERWIAHAIESALRQTWPHKEVVVVDDGSTDCSLDVIRRFGRRIRWEAGPNGGGNAARNRLLGMAEGEWLQYLDADDWLMPDKVANQMRFVEGGAEVDVLFGPPILEHWSSAGVRHECLVIPEPHDPWVLLARWHLPQTGAALWRTQAVRDVGGWKADQPCCQEHELYLRLLMARKRFAYCEAGGAVYRLWSEQTVCRRNPDEVATRRLDIEERAEEFLASHGELTAARRWSINQARFEIARSAWQRSPSRAIEIVDRIRSSQMNFRPGGDAAPPFYQVAYSLFGFCIAEKIAAWRRSVGTMLTN